MKKIALLIIITFCFLPNLAQAQTRVVSPTLSVSPAIVRQNVKSGQTTIVNISITNLGADAIPISSSKINISDISREGAPIFTTQPRPRSAIDWLEIKEPDVIVSSGEKENIEVKVTPPTGAAPGGYLGAVIFQAKLPSYYFDLDANAKVLPALTVSFLLTVEGGSQPSIDSLKISQIQAPRIVTSSPVPIITKIDNPTDYFIFLDGKISLKGNGGQTNTVDDLKSSVIFPNSSRTYVSAYSKNLLPNIYRASIEVKNDDRVLVAGTRFVALPWQYLISLILLIIMLVILLLRRRLKLAWQTLLGRQQTEPKRPIIR